MDEMLKAYAEKRRQEAGAAMELHPATRQMLQAEVARTYKQAPKASWLQGVLTLWPRVAFAAACLAITLTLVLIVLPRRTVTEMAQTKTVEEFESLERDSRLADKEKADGYALADAPAPSTAPMMPRAPGVSPSSSVDQLAKNTETEVKAKSETLADARKDNNNGIRLMREEAAKKPAARQSFVNVTNAEGISSRARYAQQPAREVQLGARLQTTQPILNTFELEQLGNVVRLYDEDGSVYSGNVVLNEDAKKQFYKLPENAPVAAQGGAAGPMPGEQQLFFRAAGTNLRLNQQVSIEANILKVTNGLPGLAPTEGVRQQQRRLTPQQTIQGRAQVGTNQEVIINAVPTQP